MNRMRFLFRLLLFITLLQLTIGAYTQNSISSLDKAYGLDPVLYNGKIYAYFLTPGTGGTQFLFGPDFIDGSVVIRGLTYDKIELNYDVFNKQVIFQYEHGNGVRKQIVLSDAWLETFNLGNVHFEMLAIEDTVRQIYQVIGSGAYRMVFSWRKDLTVDNHHGATNHVFSEPIRTAFLYESGKLMKFKNNKSFIALFDPADQTALKKYLRQQHINLKKASDQVIIELLNYCNSLSLK